MVLPTLPSNFVKMRIATLVWGFAISWAFTGKLIVAIPMFATMALGNTFLMWIWSR